MIEYLDYKFLDFNAIIDNLEILNFDMDLLGSTRDSLQYQLYVIPFVMILRKSIDYMAGRDLNDPRVIAQIIIDAYPKESLSAIKKKADYALTIKDPCECLEFDENKQVKETKKSKARDGLLAYADCLNFK